MRGSCVVRHNLPFKDRASSVNILRRQTILLLERRVFLMTVCFFRNTPRLTTHDFWQNLIYWNAVEKNFLPYISPFHVKVKLKYEIEKYIVVKNNQQEQFYEMGDYQLQMIPVAAE